MQIKEEKWNGNPFFGLQNVSIGYSKNNSKLNYFTVKNERVYRLYLIGSGGFTYGDFEYIEFNSKNLKNNDTIGIVKNAGYLKVNGILKKIY